MDSARLSLELCRQKAEDCLALAEKVTDPKHKAAMLQFAEWWMRLAEYTPSFTVILRPSPDEDCQGSKVWHSISISFRAFTQPGDDPTLIEEEAA